MQGEFDFDKYPYKAGHRGVRTSIISANDTNKRLSRLKKQVLIELGKVYPKGLSTSQLADKTKISLLTVRPRTTELKLQGLIVDTEKDDYSDLPLYRLNEASSKDIKIKIVTKNEVQSLVDFKEKINTIK